MGERTFLGRLRCSVCGVECGATPQAACPECFGPLEPVYDREAQYRSIERSPIPQREGTLWRYAEFLPVDGAPRAGLESGWTPLRRARRLAQIVGVRTLWIKDDTVNRPSLSFKDRVVAVSLTKALEFGLEVAACASTGNLANALAAQAARAGMKAVVLVPDDLERAKILFSSAHGARVVPIRGVYDKVNRLCAEAADALGWAIVNVNLRAYYAEGSKTVGFEIAEQLGWRLPRHVVVPMAGGSLITKIRKSFREFVGLGLVRDAPCSLHGAQPDGCSPIVRAVRSGAKEVTPVTPKTVVRSLAIGDPADGPRALETIRSSGGSAAAPTDEEVLESIEILARTEGVFAETAGGVTLAGAQRLVREGAIGPDDEVVLAITGHGLKTVEALEPRARIGPSIDANLDALRAWLAP
ncbi:MAG: threonine synthase [Planctomycetes bacterium]|nr:threonine synthase [Planctomycetota bacterium]